MAELLASLGDLPASRVRLQPPPGQATEKDVLYLQAHKDRLCELVDGTLVEKAMAFYESRLAMVLIHLISNFLDEHDLGIVTGPDGMMRLGRGLVRIPDVAFLSWKQFPNHLLPREPIPDLFPNLAVEIMSASNTVKEMARKRREYFKAGAQVVWLVYPDEKKIEVYSSVKNCLTYQDDQVVPGEPVLPGFQLSIRDWFQRADAQEA